MTTFRRIFSVGLLAAACVSISAAASVTFTATPFSNNTDFTTSFTLPDFNIAGQTLTGVTLSFTGSLNTTQLILQNQANSTLAGGVQTFTYQSTSTLAAVLGTDSDDPTLNLSGLSSLFLIENTGSIVLGGGGNQSTVNCAASTPTASCNTVNFATIALADGPATSSISDPTVGDYIGAGTFTLGANTSSFLSIGGGGNNIQVNQTTTGTEDVSVIYTYQPTAAPEPATLFLMGSALLGVGVLRKRFKA